MAGEPVSVPLRIYSKSTNLRVRGSIPGELDYTW